MRGGDRMKPPDDHGERDADGVLAVIHDLVAAHPAEYRSAQEAWIDNTVPRSPFSGALEAGLQDLCVSWRGEATFTDAVGDAHARLWSDGGRPAVTRGRWAAVLSVVCILLSLATARADRAAQARPMADTPAIERPPTPEPTPAPEKRVAGTSPRPNIEPVEAARVLELFRLLDDLDRKYGVTDGEAS